MCSTPFVPNVQHRPATCPASQQQLHFPWLCYPLQLTLERSYKQQQDKVEAEQAQLAADANRLAAAVAYRKVNLQIAGLQDYQAVFEGVVDYVCCVMGLAARAKAEPAARAQVSAAVESAFPLSGVAYFQTLHAQERLQQVRGSAAAVGQVLAGTVFFVMHARVRVHGLREAAAVLVHDSWQHCSRSCRQQSVEFDVPWSGLGAACSSLQEAA